MFTHTVNLDIRGYFFKHILIIFLDEKQEKKLDIINNNNFFQKCSMFTDRSGYSGRQRDCMCINIKKKLMHMYGVSMVRTIYSTGMVQSISTFGLNGKYGRVYKSPKKKDCTHQTSYWSIKKLTANMTFTKSENGINLNMLKILTTYTPQKMLDICVNFIKKNIKKFKNLTKLSRDLRQHFITKIEI